MHSEHCVSEVMQHFIMNAFSNVLFCDHVYSTSVRNVYLNLFNVTITLTSHLLKACMQRLVGPMGSGGSGLRTILIFEAFPSYPASVPDSSIPSGPLISSSVIHNATSDHVYSARMNRWSKTQIQLSALSTEGPADRYPGIRLCQRLVQ